ncbi:hypothetical protein CEK29_21365 [Bordetella genomosp. 5]|uniref:type II toxin-antitoxin system TacA family antitoxin n=1 Tax=Bordetella genomosp. 5 TaxID=1395608 RepID=UPI000B9E9D98|nr:DUF1778 domain-containing protein [Bordetella genomosp. 5]OZI33406.1 hypothetical protein CEK29_21365 [Bordetella genomosp. 5]
MAARRSDPTPPPKAVEKRKRPARDPKSSSTGLVLAEPDVSYGAASQRQAAHPSHASKHRSLVNESPGSALLEDRPLQAATPARARVRQARATELERASSNIVGQLRKLIAQELKRIDEPRTARLDARLTAKERAVIQRAADISGRSLSDFVVHAAHQAALQEIEQQVILQLSGRDSDTLAAALETEPAEPTAAFKRAVALRDRILRGTKPEKE